MASHRRGAVSQSTAGRLTKERGVSRSAATDLTKRPPTMSGNACSEAPGCQRNRLEFNGQWDRALGRRFHAVLSGVPGLCLGKPRAECVIAWHASAKAPSKSSRPERLHGRDCEARADRQYLRSRKRWLASVTEGFRVSNALACSDTLLLDPSREYLDSLQR